MSNEIEKSRFSIDPNDLDSEWIEQPVLAFKIHRKLADLEFELADAERNLEMVESRAGLDARERLINEKVTEARIKSEVILSDTYQEAYKRAVKAKHDLSVIKSAVVAVEHKKRALENLVILKRQEYFSNPVESQKEPPRKPAGVSKKRKTE
jgi:hypothetical protein